MGSLIDIKDLNLSFSKDINVLQNVSLSLVENEIVGLVGESGSGKTMLSLCMMGLHPPNAQISGEILYSNEDRALFNILETSQKILSNIRGTEVAMVFQNPVTALNPTRTCGDQLRETWKKKYGRANGLSRSEILDWLAKLELNDPERIYRAYPHMLSGGQLQRVVLCGALLVKPRLLIADEPTTALDVTTQAEILKSLRGLCAETGTSLLFISHDLSVVAEIADRVLIMRGGKIVERGAIADVFKTPEHPYTRGLLACRPPIDRKLKALPVLEDYLSEKTDMTGPTAVTPNEIMNRSQALQKARPILILEGINRSFERRRLFKTDHVVANSDIHLVLKQGEVLGIAGESGSGKSTMARIIAGLTQADSGQIRFLDNDKSRLLTKRMSRHLRKSVQIIFQDPYSALYPHKTIGYGLNEALDVFQVSRKKEERLQKVEQLLKEVGLSKTFLSRYPHQLSGGEKQRVQIARALAPDPEVLICDECVSALDVSVQAKILNLLKNTARERGLSVIFISHDLAVLRFIADRLVVMQAGKVVEEGDVENIFTQPSTVYTKKLLEAIPGLQD